LGFSLLVDIWLHEERLVPEKADVFCYLLLISFCILNQGAGKSAVLNSLIGHPVLPTGENGATRAPIIIELSRESSLSSKAIILQIDNKSQQVSASALRHSLQDRLSKGASGKNRDEINLKLRTSTGKPLFTCTIISGKPISTLQIAHP
jgi:hypothetical protein